MTPMRANIVGPRVEILAARLPHNHVGPQQETASLADLDENDPPTFEAQATYLERHKLFLPGERKRLAKVDWEAESA